MSEDREKKERPQNEIIRDILNRQMEVIEKLTRMEDNIEDIKKHTSTMNNELGECQKSITCAQADIKEIKNKPLMKIGWKDISKIVGLTSTIVGIIYTLLRIFVFKA